MSEVRPRDYPFGLGCKVRNAIGRPAEAFVAIAFFAAIFQVLGWILGQDVGWDQGNYHLSSVYAWLHGKPWPDYAVSQQQSWFNPLPGLPAYLIVTGLGAKAAAIALAVLPVLNAAALWALVRRFVFPGRSKRAAVLALACTFVGVTGTIHLAVVATTMVEAWMPSLVLCAFYAMTAAINQQRKVQVRNLALAGLLLGLAVGLKPTNAPFVVGAVLALAIFRRRVSDGLAPLAAFASGGILGVMAGGAWWMIPLWAVYGDPAFPMLSRAGNAWIGVDALSHEGFSRHHVWQLLVDPFLLAIGDHSRQLSTVMPVRDARYLIGFYSSLGLVANRLRLWRAGVDVKDCAPEFLGTVFLTSYVSWAVIFNVDRYAIPLELLAPAMPALLATRLGWLKTRKAAGYFLVFLAVVVLASRPIRTARAHLASDWFNLSIPSGLAAPGTLYVMTGWGDIAWLTLFEDRLGPGSSYVRVAGNLRIDRDRALGQRIAGVIQSHTGPIRSLTKSDEMGALGADLAGFGLEPDPGKCLTMTSQRGEIVSCAVIRHAARGGL